MKIDRTALIMLAAARHERERRQTAERAKTEEAAEQLLAKLEEMGRRFLAVTPPAHAGLPPIAAIIEELMQADGDWSRIDEIQIKADLAPADAIAIVLTQDPKLAMRMLTDWARARGLRYGEHKI